jgi:hypothetical protein
MVGTDRGTIKGETLLIVDKIIEKRFYGVCSTVKYTRFLATQNT